jgi:hypothetical protein
MYIGQGPESHIPAPTDATQTSRSDATGNKESIINGRSSPSLPQASSSRPLPAPPLAGKLQYELSKLNPEASDFEEKCMAIQKELLSALQNDKIDLPACKKFIDAIGVKLAQNEQITAQKRDDQVGSLKKQLPPPPPPSIVMQLASMKGKVEALRQNFDPQAFGAIREQLADLQIDINNRAQVTRFDELFEMVGQLGFEKQAEGLVKELTTALSQKNNSPTALSDFKNKLAELHAFMDESKTSQTNLYSNASNLYRQLEPAQSERVAKPSPTKASEPSPPLNLDSFKSKLLSLDADNLDFYSDLAKLESDFFDPRIPTSVQNAIFVEYAKFQSDPKGYQMSHTEKPTEQAAPSVASQPQQNIQELRKEILKRQKDSKTTRTSASLPKERIAAQSGDTPAGVTRARSNAKSGQGFLVSVKDFFTSRIRSGSDTGPRSASALDSGTGKSRSLTESDADAIKADKTKKSFAHMIGRRITNAFKQKSADGPGN